MAQPYEVLGEKEQYITLAPFTPSTPMLMFDSNTLVTSTIYIYNSQDIPSGSASAISITIVDWINGTDSEMNLDAFNYGKYIENYPIGQVLIGNPLPVTIVLYVQYIVKQYYEFYSPLIQDLTQLQLTPNITTESLTPGTNFRFFGPILSIDFTTFPLLDPFYVLDQQFYGTSSTAAGNVSIPWTLGYMENINVSANGVAEDPTLYVFNVDATTQLLPGSVSSNNAVNNWDIVDFFSPLYLTLTATVGSNAIYYNSVTNGFEADSMSTVHVCASYMHVVPAVSAPITAKVN